MKRRFLIWALVGILLLFPSTVRADPQEEGTQAEGDSSLQTDQEEEVTAEDWEREFQNVLDGTDLTKMQRDYSQADEMTKELIGTTSLRGAVELAARGELQLDAWGILKMLGGGLIDELGKNSGLLLQILVLAIISALLGMLRPNFSNDSIAEIGSFILYLFVIALIAQSLLGVLEVGRGAIESMVGIMESVFPVMLVFLTAMGGLSTNAIFKPAMALLTGSIGTFVQNAILPGILIIGVLTIIQHVSSRIQIKKIKDLGKKIIQWSIGAIFVVFLGVTALQGLTGATYDGVTVRTAKFAIDKVVPIVGGMFSDTVDTLIGCSLVVKNGVGIVGLLMICGAMLTPIIRIAAMSFLYWLAAAVIEPFGDRRISDCLSDMAGVYTMLYVCVLAVGVMMFIMITLLISAGNISVMLR